jgi:hypothetical protein
MSGLREEEGRLAVQLARQSLHSTVTGRQDPLPSLPPVFDEKRGVFVTLTRSGQLRGCIGFPYPVAPLGEAIVDAAHAAAVEDPRFHPVRPEELGSIRVEVTVLTEPVVIEGPAAERAAKVEVGRHGLIVRGKGTSGLLLPQVATEYNWESEEFLSSTCAKAGLAGRCWRDQDVEVSTFEGQIFHESLE